MVAGATGIDMFLLVVAADDGVMPQTREHLAILALLDVPAGVVAMTKRDLVDDELAELARLSIEELLEDSPYAGSPIVEVSSRTGAGIEDLRVALDGLAGDARSRAAAGEVRLPIDRAFSLRGIGTVVTGTLWSGTVRVGDRLAIEPGGREVRVRSVQVHDRGVEEAAAGQRVALALVGVERTQVKRGDTAASPGTLPRSFRLDCRLRVLPSASRGLRNGDVVTVHHGTAEAPARVALRTGSEVPPGGIAEVQLRLRRRVSAAAGDRLIVRLTSPQVTVAGATVTDPAPPRGRSRPTAPPPQAPPPPRPSIPAAVVDELESRLAASPLQPPALGPADAAAVTVLVEQGRAVRAGRDLAFTAEAFEQARSAAVELAGAAGSVTLAQLRDRLGISRKYAQALLEAMDAHGITRRIGDERVLRRRGRE
jgi:selenocysteine-specific elongation factor